MKTIVDMRPTIAITKAHMKVRTALGLCYFQHANHRVIAARARGKREEWPTVCHQDTLFEFFELCLTSL